MLGLAPVAKYYASRL